MPPPERARLYRLVFGLAAAYNTGFGLWAALRPASSFDLFKMALVIARDRFPHTGLVPPDRHVDPEALWSRLAALDVRLVEAP